MVLIGIGETTHSTHYAKHVIVGGVDSNLSSFSALNGGVGKNKL